MEFTVRFGGTDGQVDIQMSQQGSGLNVYTCGGKNCSYELCGFCDGRQGIKTLGYIDRVVIEWCVVVDWGWGGGGGQFKAVNICTLRDKATLLEVVMILTFMPIGISQRLSI